MSELNKTFICEACKGEFTKAWTDEQRDAEHRRNFGRDPGPGDVIVCTECLEKILGRAARVN